MIEYKNGKEYWDGTECDRNFVFRTLADMYPQDYVRYMKESIEFKKRHTVLHCFSCHYEWVYKEMSITNAKCPFCKSMEFHRL